MKGVKGFDCNSCFLCGLIFYVVEYYFLIVSDILLRLIVLKCYVR